MRIGLTLTWQSITEIINMKIKSLQRFFKDFENDGLIYFGYYSLFKACAVKQIFTFTFPTNFWKILYMSSICCSVGYFLKKNALYEGDVSGSRKFSTLENSKFNINPQKSFEVFLYRSMARFHICIIHTPW